jgi:teichuronic acid biosynthesis glycosyltransferase TuaG
LLENPFFSIIMPAYNAADYITEAIESVIAQEFLNWELLVIDDGSTDETQEIVNGFIEKDTRVKLYSQPNQGLAGARNTGLRNAKAEWIAFLDSDDIWLPQKLQVQYKTLQSVKADVVFSNGYTLFEGNLKPGIYHFEVLYGLFSGDTAYKELLKQNFIPVLSVIVNRLWIERIGLQDEDVTSGSEDWDYWLRLAKAGATFYGIEERLFIYRVHKNGMSAKNLRQSQSSYEVLLKNYDGDILSPEEKSSFIKRQLGFVKQLIRNRNIRKAYDIYIELVSIKKNSRLLNKVHFAMLAISASVPKISTVQTLKKSSYKATIFLPFHIVRFAGRYQNLLNSHYHRWLYQGQLKRTALFFMHKTSKINMVSGSRFTTNGFGLHDFSIINVNHQNSVIYLSNDVVFYRYCIINIWDAKLTIGCNVSFNNYCSINCMNSIDIGNNSWFGEGVRMYDHNHKFNDSLVPFTAQGFTSKPIKIGNNCWIGSNTVLLQGVEIGDNSVIGANNLIHKSVPPNTIVKARAMESMETIDRN